MGLIQNKVTVSQPNSHVVVKNAGGLRGLTGEIGPQGPQGVPGEAATVTAGTTTTLPAGSDATVQNVGSTSAAIFNFGIPKGDKGDTGESGAAATISVGSTSTLPAGSSATVTNSGTSSAAVFDFGIPKGTKGDTGSQGPAGQDGADGFSPTATVTKTGDTATITITDKDGTTTAQISDGVTPTIDPALSPTSENPVQNKVVTNALAGKADKPIVVSSLPATGTAGQEYFVDDRYNTVTELKGDTTQTTYSGKNLLNITKGTFTQNGITFTQNPDGSVTMNGTSTGNAYYEMNNTTASQTMITSGVKYTLSIGNTPLPSGQVVVQIRKVNPNVIYAAVNDKSASFTAPETTTTFTYIGVYGSGVTLNNVTIYPMLEVGSSMTSFEPYVGGTASPNPDYPQEVQTVTGEQTVTVVGKNLFNKAAITSGKIVSRTDGTLADNVNYGATEYIPVVAGQQYRFTAGFNYWYTAVYDKDKKYVSNVDNAQTITIPAGVSYIRSTVYISQLNDAQFEKGSASTPYEPYKGVTKTVNLGKNLFQATATAKDSWQTVYAKLTDNSFTVAKSSASITSSAYTELSLSGLLPNTTYTLSYDSSVSGTAQQGAGSTRARVNGTWGGFSTDNRLTFTTDSTSVASVAFYAIYGTGTSGDATVTFSNVQIEKGSSATTYAPYFTPIELCKIGTYQDYIYKSGEDWYVKNSINKLALNGSESWETTGTNVYALYVSGGIKSVAEGLSGVCNYYTFNPVQTNVTITLTTGQFAVQYINPNTQHRVFMKNTAISTTSDFQTWLGSHNTTVYYPLATPTDTQITNADLIAQLEALAGAKIMVDGGTATVTSQYLPAILTTAYNSNSGYIDYIYDGTNFVKVR